MIRYEIKRYINRKKNIKFLNKIKCDKFNYKIIDDNIYVYIKSKTYVYSINCENTNLTNWIITIMTREFKEFNIKWIK